MTIARLGTWTADRGSSHNARVPGRRSRLNPTRFTTRDWIDYAIVCLVFGTTWLAIRHSLASFPPLAGLGLRYAIAGVVLFLVARARGLPFPSGARAWRMPVVIGLLMFTIPYAMIYYAERTVPSGLTAVLFASNAIFTAVVTHFALPDERLSLPRVLGIAIGFLGVVVVFWERMRGHASWIGEAMIVGSAAIQGTTGTLVRKNPSVPPVVQSCIGAGVAAVTTLAASTAFEREPFAHATWQGWAAVLYLALAGSVIAFTLVLKLIHRVGANRVASSVYVTPVIALLLGKVLEDEPFGARLAVGSALVLFGVWLANRAA
jgi:drug/metabolite transporter (DMT)-like permease